MVTGLRGWEYWLQQSWCLYFQKPFTKDIATILIYFYQADVLVERRSLIVAWFLFAWVFIFNTGIRCAFGNVYKFLV